MTDAYGNVITQKELDDYRKAGGKYETLRGRVYKYGMPKNVALQVKTQQGRKMWHGERRWR